MPNDTDELPGGLRLTLQHTADEAAAEFMHQQLREYNNAHSPYHRESRTPETAPQPLEIYVRDASGALLGGLTGDTVWDWLYIARLWLADSLRGSGLGTRLMGLAEDEARRRDCTHAHLRTFSFQARGFYEKLGYRVIGALEGYPPGEAFYWMRKDFT